jgi:type IV secretory pathway VirB10-like protein
MVNNESNMVLVKIIHPGAVKTKRGILPAPVNRIIKLDYNEACLLKAQGVSITILSKVNSEVKKTDEPKKKITRVVNPVPVKEEKKEEVKEEVKAEELPKTEEENPAPVEEEVVETTEEESVEEASSDETAEETQKELTEESTNKEDEESEETQEEEIPAKSEETIEEVPSDDELTVEDVKACNNFDELKEYATQLEINAEGLSKKKLKEAIIKALN